MIGFVSTALTWIKAFKGPCLVLAGVALIAGATVSAFATRAIMRGDVTRAEQRLSDFRAELATQSAGIERYAAERQRAAFEIERERTESITAAVDRIPAIIARQQAAQFSQLWEFISDARYDCLRQPLPEPFLDGLRRPGGSALDTGR